MRARISAIVGAALIVVALASTMLDAFHLTELIERLIPNWMDQWITPRVDLVIFLAGFLLIGLAWIDYKYESGNGSPELPLPSPFSETSANTSSSRPAHMSKDHTVAAGKNSPIIIDSPVSADMSAPVSGSQVAIGTNISQIGEVHHHHGESGFSEKWIPTELTPIQILQEIDAALPSAKDHARANYKDLTVVWETSLRDLKANPHGADSGWLVITSFPAELVSINLVHFHLSSLSAELRSATVGSVLLIKGAIESVDHWYIGLKPDPEIRIIKRA